MTFILLLLLAFDGDSAFRHIEELGEIGPRPPGTPACDEGYDYIIGELSALSDSFEVQRFVYDGIVFRNLIAHQGNGAPRVLLGTHWDTRPIAERENPRLPVFGSNDGTSGVAVLLELLRSLRERGCDYPLDVVLFDGEDYGPRPLILGSQYFAGVLQDPSEYDFGVIVDMVGDANLEIYREISSYSYASEYVNAIWETAKDLGITAFRDTFKYEMNDDHRPLNEIGIPTVLIIDFDYPSWHTLQDTPDKCSPRSLEAVGRVLERFLDLRFGP
jgi:hypothetical protein